jgi:glycosyltransferase involved in cell wall biosynthesis
LQAEFIRQYDVLQNDQRMACGVIAVTGMVGIKPQVNRTLLFVVNVDWFFMSHRLPIALAAMRAGYSVHIATGMTDKHAEMQASGLKIHPLPLVRGGVGVVNAIYTAWCLLRIVKAVRPDVMHLVTIKPVLLGGLVARFLRVPALVSAVSGLGYVFMAKGLAAKLRLHVVRRVYAWALGHANQLVIFQNHNDKVTLQASTGLPSRKSVLIRGSGVDLQQYTVQPFPSGKPVVMFPARLLADKGAFEFVAAAKQLRFEGVQARFVMVGLMDTANPTSLTKAQVDAWVSDGVVEHWGHRVDMPAVLASATVVVLPSYREGLPKVLVEAGACGRPVVTTDVPGCRDAIEAGQTGILVPAGNSAKLAEAITTLLQNRKLCSLMGQAGRALAEREFDVQAVVNKHLAIYDQLLA